MIKRFKKFIAKHTDGLFIAGLCSLFMVADSEPLEILAWSPIPIVLFGMSMIGARINDSTEDEESL